MDKLKCQMCLKEPLYKCHCDSPSVLLCQTHMESHSKEFPTHRVSRIDPKFAKFLFTSVMANLSYIASQLIQDTKKKHSEIKAEFLVTHKEVNELKRWIEKKYDEDDFDQTKIIEAAHKLGRISGINSSMISILCPFDSSAKSDTFQHSHPGGVDSVDCKIYKEIVTAVVYKGETINNEANGKGACKYADNSTYTGDWLAGKRHGYGVNKYADGSVYIGEWKDDKRCGKGVLRCSDESVYDGYWQDNIKSGKGKFTYPNGDVYIGEFLLDKRNGKGNYISTSSSYSGNWINDEKSGECECIDASGIITKETWNN